jgi:hypothetical protein
MKNLINAIFILFLFFGTLNSQVVQSNFTGVLVPQYMCSGTATRLPYIFRATVSGLGPNSTYRYYTQACRYTDIGGTNSGAGNPILINANGMSFRYSSSTSLVNSTSYDSLTTDTGGNYTGWFGFVNTGNARFTAGNYIIPTITIDSICNGTAKYRFALNDSINVLKYTDSSIATGATGIYGISLATQKSVVSLYDNVNNTGKPLAVAYVENVGIDSSSVSSLVQYYIDSVIQRDGRWGTIIPNTLANGVRRINIHSLITGEVINYNTDSNGVWPSGANTVNPTGSSTSPIRMTTEDIILISKNENTTPSNFYLMQNYPNPFNPVTTIKFSIPSNGNLELKIFNLLGQEVKNLANGSYDAGTYSVQFNALNIPSGIYFYTLRFSGKDGKNYSNSKKLVLIK